MGGILLLFPGCGMCVFEGEQNAVVQGARFVADAQAAGSITSVNVLSSIQDAPQPAFEFWATRTLSVNKGDAAHFELDMIPNTVPATLQLSSVQ